MITDIKNLKDQVLLDLAKTKAQEERDLTLAMIDIIREIITRQLHLSRGYSSLHEFCVKELKYSDGTAGRRIRALELVTAMPQVSESIKAGAINMTTASQVQSFFKAQEKNKKPMNAEDKTKLVKDLENKSSREVEKALVSLLPEPAKPQEKIRPVSKNHFELKATIEGEFLKKIERLMALTSHKHSTAMELMETLVDAELKRCDPELKAPKKAKAKDSVAGDSAQKLERENELEGTTVTGRGQAMRATAKVASGPSATSLNRASCAPARYIKQEIKRQIWVRDQSRCTYTDPVTKRRCEQTKYLQLEHIVPFAQGGNSRATNLKLLCSNHNKLMAVQTYGLKHMSQFGA